MALSEDENVKKLDFFFGFLYNGIRILQHKTPCFVNLLGEHLIGIGCHVLPEMHAFIHIVKRYDKR